MYIYIYIYIYRIVVVFLPEPKLIQKHSLKGNTNCLAGTPDHSEFDTSNPNSTIAYTRNNCTEQLKLHLFAWMLSHDSVMTIL